MLLNVSDNLEGHFANCTLFQMQFLMQLCSSWLLQKTSRDTSFKDSHYNELNQLELRGQLMQLKLS